MDWESNRMPCKHFMAVLQSKEISASLESFPEEYRNCAHFTLDEEVLFDGNFELPTGSHRKVSEDVSNDITFADPTESDIESVNFLKLPVRKYASRSKAAACRDVLNQIRTLTFLVYDEEVLENLHSDLLRSLNQLEASAPQEHGLIKEEVKTLYKAHVSNHKKANFQKIPERQRKTSKLTGRVGISADNRRRAACLDITNTVPSENHDKVIEESVDPIEMK